jgi:hypothetical protein
LLPSVGIGVDINTGIISVFFPKEPRTRMKYIRIYIVVAEVSKGNIKKTRTFAVWIC